jgi:hypothetical protein
VVVTLCDGVEIRRYAPRLAVETDVAGSDVQARNAAFGILFAYIAGGWLRYGRLSRPRRGGQSASP